MNDENFWSGVSKEEVDALIALHQSVEKEGDEHDQDSSEEDDDNFESDYFEQYT